MDINVVADTPTLVSTKNTIRMSYRTVRGAKGAGEYPKGVYQEER